MVVFIRFSLAIFQMMFQAERIQGYRVLKDMYFAFYAENLFKKLYSCRQPTSKDIFGAKFKDSFALLISKNQLLSSDLDAS